MLKNKMLSAMGGAPANYIEDVFSTWLYTGTGSTQTITNGIDLAGEGGLTINKTRSVAGFPFVWFDSTRSLANWLRSDSTNAQASNSSLLTSFNSNGFTVGTSNTTNDPGITYASWTFRKQPKFFDVVTYTGNGSARTIAHNLGSVPGCIIIKSTTAATSWAVYHTGLGNANFLTLNSANASTASSAIWNSTSPTSTVFTIGTSGAVNDVGQTYVAYLFAHDAGGFGESGEDNVISCGSFTGNGSTNGPTVTLGYEPQWLMIKRVDSTGDWPMFDNMRGIPVTGNTQRLDANGTQDEATISAAYAGVSATGFYLRTSNANFNASGGTYIYIAIRRGPMKVPESGTSVFTPIVSTASTGTALTTGFPVDMQFPIALAPTYTIANAVDRLRGVSSTTTASGLYLEQSNTNAEASGTVTRNWGNTGFEFPDYFATLKTLFLNFRRAPGFFDVVCYTGTGVARTVAHNLGVAPELMIVKCRNAAGSWWTYHVAVGNGSAVRINADTTPTVSSTFWNSTTPTDTVFSLGTHLDINGSGETNVAYLFASCPGVSKVGSYTGTGTTQQINCGFTGGARFVLIKRTDSTGAWYVWDSARGIVAGNDPYLLLNSTAAEVTSTDYVDTYSAGFEISSTAPAAINASGGSFIFLAIA